MRRNRRRNRDDEADVDMTPMLDIVFIMLIFFIVTAVFLDETGLDLTQPPPPPEDQPPPPNSPPAITVYVDENSQCSVDGARSTCSGVMARVERQLADKPGASVILRFHPEAKHDVLVQLKDGVDGRGMQSKIEVIEGAA
ncbi:biopolymer transporter ExbD [uncultured Algimonas sp.]|uniref:ExbD/TolR family protein n=1 Tax=uncultured Algimonas sp. TaxID=1547920 RepID=UPI00260547F0|nr:biopolymer transporter ExbD [uncultured Algimonas sp.]